MTCIVFLFNFNFSLIFCHHVSHLTAHFQSFSPPPDYFPLCLVIPPFPLSLLDDPVALRALVLAFPILIYCVSLVFGVFTLQLTMTDDLDFLPFRLNSHWILSALPLVSASGSDLISFGLTEHDNSVSLDQDFYIRNSERCLESKAFLKYLSWFLRWTKNIEK